MRMRTMRRSSTYISNGRFNDGKHRPMVNLLPSNSIPKKNLKEGPPPFFIPPVL